MQIHQKGFDFNHTNKLINSGHFDAAQRILSKAEKKLPKNFDVLYLKGKLASSRFQLDHAQKLFNRAMKYAQKPSQKEQALFQISTILYHNRQLIEARKLLESHIDGNYKDDKFTHQYLKILRDTKDSHKINEAIPKLIEHDPKNLQCLGLCLQCLIQSQQIDRAIETAQYFLKNNLGLYPDRTALMLLGCYEAKGDFQEGYKLLKEFDVSNSENEHIKRQLAKLDYFLSPTSEKLEKFREYAESGKKPFAEWTLSTIELGQGDFEKGIPRYEKRHIAEGKTIRVHFLPYHDLSTGLPQDNSRILLSYEQGLGDQVRFCRYLSGLSPEIKKRIAILPEPRLVPLIQRSFPDIQCYPNGKITLEHLKKDNVKTEALMASAALLNKNLFKKSDSGYFSISKDIQDSVLEILEDGKITIGVFWRSVKVNPERDLWQPSLEDFIEIFRGKNYQLLSLQNSVTDKERAIFKDAGLTLIETEIDCRDNIDGLATLCASTTAVVGVGTATSEISAATGQHTWVLATKHPDRWYLNATYMDKHYPNMHLALREVHTPWRDTLKKVRNELEKLVS
ncbi:hypothetical protein GP5015_1694 [gamma proteobacterium HTCC5015]|nr:hypothetical protein GP5015_1694 [gamma proteobacterium HTCC5015]